MLRFVVFFVACIVLCGVWEWRQGTQEVAAGEQSSRSTQISTGDDQTCPVLVSGMLPCRGAHPSGQTGYGYVQNGLTVDGGRLALGGTDFYGDAIPMGNVVGIAAPSNLSVAATLKPTASKTSTRSKTKTKTPTKSKTPTRTRVGYVSRVQALASGGGHTCALLASSVVKCWGSNGSGQLGAGNTTSVGDAVGEMGNALPAVDLGTGVLAKKIYGGEIHTCILTTTNRVKCWGTNESGALGIGDAMNRGDASGEMGDALPFVDLGTGRTAVELALGSHVTCALLTTHAVFCWGRNDFGQLGIGSTDPIGDNLGEMGTALQLVNLGTGRTAISIAASAYGICAILDNATIKCWGDNRVGQLGTGDTANRGDQSGEMGDNLLALPFASNLTPVELATSAYSACARFDNGNVRCWGRGDNADLGNGDSNARGDNPSEVAALTAINLGSGHSAKHIFGSKYSGFCVILDDDSLKCWGANSDANLGIGISSGDTKWGNAAGEMGDSLPTIDLGTGVTVSTVSAGGLFRCAIVKFTTAVKCWGNNNYGQLGLESTYAAWGEYPDATMGDYLPIVRMGAIIPSTVTPTPSKTLTASKTLTPTRTHTVTKTPIATFTPTLTLSPAETATQTSTPIP